VSDGTGSNGWIEIPRTQHAALMEAARAIKQFADPANWSDRVACLQWIGKRHAIDWADDLLSALKAAGIETER
jgi:hypothetical protein